jgi:hypothetical protein
MPAAIIMLWLQIPLRQKLTLYSDTINFTALKADAENNIAAQAPGKNSFWVYPNPAKNILHVTTNSKASVSLLSLFRKNIA